MESPNTTTQAIKLNTSCSVQAYSNRPGTGSRHKNTEPGCVFTVLRIQSIICPIRSAASPARLFKKHSAHMAQTGVYILVSLGEYLRIHLKNHTGYDQGPEIHGNLRRVSLPVGEAQLTGCLKVWVVGLLEWEEGIQ